MKVIKEITVFTNGDSCKISTWSNVPFFFTETLISKGIKVNRVDISPSPFFNKFFNYTIYRILKVINKQTTYDYFRSYIHSLDVNRRIKKAIKTYPNSEINIFLTFSFSSTNLTKKPTVLFGDWTYDHHFQYFTERKPDLFERSSIKRENSHILNSDLVIPLFPKVATYMKQRYSINSIHYLGNVINSLHDTSQINLLEAKENSFSLLFVGSKKYIEGVKVLIDAFKNLKKTYPLLNLHIIGMNDSDLVNLPKDVYCYGYLNKDVEDERILYYKLFREAKIFINTTPKWAGFSSMIEAMYFYIPIIVSPYDEVVETFGKSIDFGYYSSENTADQIEKNITNILNHKSYNSLCTKANEAVKEFTWDNYIDKMINLLKEEIQL